MDKSALLNKQILNLTLFILILGVFFIGSSMNFVAVANNGGKMPVLFYDFEFESEKHFSFTQCIEVNYCYLTDVFPLGSYIFSIGDFLIIVSLGIELFLIIKILKTKNVLKKFD